METTATGKIVMAIAATISILFAIAVLFIVYKMVTS